MRERSGAIAVLYDGICPVCLRSIRWLRRLDRNRRLEFLNSRNWPAIATRFPHLDREACLEEIHIVHPGGRTLRGFDAYRSLIWVLPWAVPLAPIFYIPGVPLLGRPLARAFARHRMRIRIPPPNMGSGGSRS